mmetsp:Transcript_6608/g.11622  ORF Transcript_6608/g.11622 Transcript_6608/m.11622 type:complete len:283 (-) Transcript_6608:764-1612(-)
MDVAVVYKPNNGAWMTKNMLAVPPGIIANTEIIHHASSFRIMHKNPNVDEWDRKSVSLVGQPSDYVHYFCEGTTSAGTSAITSATTTSTTPAHSTTLSNESWKRAVDNSLVTGRDAEWIIEHNEIRQLYHTKYLGDGSSYPLVWSRDLKKNAQSYADELINMAGCEIRHDATWAGGENIAFNRGGLQPPVVNVMARWVTMEENLPFPNNGHFIQVLWRTTEYVGCAEATKMDQGKRCYIQVCRYIRKGNCEVNEGNWHTKMLADFSFWNGPYPCLSPFQILA